MQFRILVAILFTIWILPCPGYDLRQFLYLDAIFNVYQPKETYLIMLSPFSCKMFLLTFPNQKKTLFHSLSVPFDYRTKPEKEEPKWRTECYANG